ncbi:unnamed protein product, partial [Brugia pahangi]
MCFLLSLKKKEKKNIEFQVPDDSKAFSNLQIDRLLKRNRINEQLQLLKNEALKLRVFSADGEQGCSNSTIKLAAMEGLDRLHIITDDNEVQIIDDEKEAKKKDLIDSLAWPTFLEKNGEKKDIEDAKEMFFTHQTDKSNDFKIGAFPCDDNDDDDDDEDSALQEAIHASLLENSAEKCNKFQMGTYGYNQESKGDMIQRLRTAFTERAQDLHHDTWSSSSSESSDEFVEIFPEFFEKLDVPL